MDSKEAIRTCGQCFREVAEANFALHETHCRRFLCLCPDCDEAVPKDQLEEHREEQHTPVRCSKCKKKIERCRLQDHELDECLERLQKCQFCELEVPWKEVEEHRVVCGSRTELCRDCGRYVKLTDWSEHDLTCSAADRSSGPSPAASGAPHSTANGTVFCRSCMGSFSAQDIDKHQVECFLAAKWDYDKFEPEEEEHEDDSESSEQEDTPQLMSPSAVTHTFSQRSSMHGGDPDKISTCPHCHLALPVFTLRWHEAKCHVHIVLKKRKSPSTLQNGSAVSEL